MSDEKKIICFRKNRARDIRNVAKTLEKVFGSERGVLNVTTTPLYNAANDLEKGIIANAAIKNDCWGYEIVDFKMPVETLRHIRPQGIKKVELTLNMSLEANCSDWGTLKDPLRSLNFNVVLKAISDKNNYLCFHVDKHDMSRFSEEPHPIYHIQYSPKPKGISDENFDYGNVMYFDTPRLMHQPLDLILGIGFLISNFAPSKWDSLKEDRFFVSAYKECQKSILRPYSYSLANNWKPIEIDDSIWQSKDHICPYLI
ncbi:MAG: hypothetical protein N4A50_10510 [Vallitalea sp.]|jgi:hypothetical protein|nr:hypothetical protein [Vallitalea sp.]